MSLLMLALSRLSALLVSAGVAIAAAISEGALKAWGHGRFNQPFRLAGQLVGEGQKGNVVAHEKVHGQYAGCRRRD